VLIDQPVLGGYQLGCTPATGDCHGTQMVGIAGARWDSVGLAGVSGLRPNVNHISLRCASLSHVSDALAYAATVLFGSKGVVVIGLDVLELYKNSSLCLALLADAARFEAAIHTAQTTSDLLIVMPSGNYDPTGSAPLSAIPKVPPDVSGSLIVGACDHSGTGRLSDFGRGVASRFGPDLSLVAPGENVYTAFDTTATPPNYASVWGTSFAAAHVAGVAALCRATFPGLNAAAIKTKLMSSVTGLTTVVPDPELGMGLIDGSKAVV
jgi:subtilisin family serine protease